MPEETMTIRQDMSLVEGVIVMMGIIVGCGIFISPREVLVNTGSLWGSLIIWAVCGVFATIGAMCYAELGINFAKSLDFTYIYVGRQFENKSHS